MRIRCVEKSCHLGQGTDVHLKANNRAFANHVQRKKVACLIRLVGLGWGENVPTATVSSTTAAGKTPASFFFSTWVHCKRISKTPHILKLASKILYGWLVVARMQIPRQDVLQNKMVSHQFFLKVSIEIAIQYHSQFIEYTIKLFANTELV